MAEQKRTKSVRNPQARTDEGADFARLASRLDLSVASSVDSALRAAFSPTTRGFMPPFWWFPTDAASAESLLGEAGIAVAEMEDFSVSAEKHANKLSDASQAKSETARGDVRKELDKDLKDARSAKNKVAGAAVAAKKFGPARPGIVDAEKSFNEADDLLGQYDDNLPNTNDNYKAQNQRLKDAAKKIKDDVDHLKDALAQIV